MSEHSFSEQRLVIKTTPTEDLFKISSNRNLYLMSPSIKVFGQTLETFTIRVFMGNHKPQISGCQGFEF